MRAFLESFGAWWGALSAILLFLVLASLYAMWFMSHNAPEKPE